MDFPDTTSKAGGVTVSPLRLLFAQNVRRLRKQQGWTQEDLGDQTGIHRTYIGAIERGEANITLDHLEKLAKGLNTSVVALLKPEDPGSGHQKFS